MNVSQAGKLIPPGERRINDTMADREPGKQVAKPNLLADPPGDDQEAADDSHEKLPAASPRDRTDVEDRVFELGSNTPSPEPEPRKKKTDAEPASVKDAPPAPTSANPEVEPQSAAKPAPARRARRANAPTFYVAGFWRRFLAGGIDFAIILPVSLLMCWLTGAVAGVHLPAARYRGLDFWLDLLLSSDPALVGALSLTLAIAAVYLLVFQITQGRTLGMKVLKIRIIDVYGDQPSTQRSALRTAGYIAAVGTLGLGFLWVGFDSEKRGLHDWISSTYVVKA